MCIYVYLVCVYVCTWSIKGIPLTKEVIKERFIFRCSIFYFIRSIIIWHITRMIDEILYKFIKYEYNSSVKN